MLTNKNIHYYVNFGSKIILGLGCGVFGAVHFFTGSLILGILAAGIGAVFVKDSFELRKKHNAQLETNSEFKNIDDQNKDKKNTLVKIPKMHRNKSLSSTSNPSIFLAPNTATNRRESAKNKHKSEPRHTPKPSQVTSLDLSPENLAVSRPRPEKNQSESRHISRIKLESGTGYLPSGSLMTKKSPKRLSQQPSRQAIASARQMTEEELEQLMNTDSPKKNVYNK